MYGNDNPGVTSYFRVIISLRRKSAVNNYGKLAGSLLVF